MTMNRNGLSSRVAREEQAEGQRVQLSLAHDAQGGALLPVDGDLELDLSEVARTR